MYNLSIQRDFIAQHYLIGGDWGAENQLHAHHYKLDLRLEGYELDQHGYLVDIVHLEALLDALVARYRNQILNDQPEFAGLNPSIEHFSRILSLRLADGLKAANICALTVRLWETDVIWASYRHDLPCKYDLTQRR